MGPVPRVSRFALVAGAVLIFGCGPFMHGYTTSKYAGRMLPVGEEDGAYRLKLESSVDPAAREFVEENGSPQYLIVLDRKRLGLIYTGRDMAVLFERRWTIRSEVKRVSPIPDEIVTALPQQVREDLLTRRSNVRVLEAESRVMSAGTRVKQAEARAKQAEARAKQAEAHARRAEEVAGRAQSRAQGPQGTGREIRTPPPASAAPRPGPAEPDLIPQAKQSIAAGLKDPSSAQWRNMRTAKMADGSPAVCGEINAKNSYGAYIGFSRFVWSAKDGRITTPASLKKLGVAHWWPKFWGPCGYSNDNLSR